MNKQIVLLTKCGTELESIVRSLKESSWHVDQRGEMCSVNSVIEALSVQRQNVLAIRDNLKKVGK